MRKNRLNDRREEKFDFHLKFFNLYGFSKVLNVLLIPWDTKCFVSWSAVQEFVDVFLLAIFRHAQMSLGTCATIINGKNVGSDVSAKIMSVAHGLLEKKKMKQLSLKILKKCWLDKNSPFDIEIFGRRCRRPRTYIFGATSSGSLDIYN